MYARATQRGSRSADAADKMINVVESLRRDPGQLARCRSRQFRTPHTLWHRDRYDPESISAWHTEQLTSRSVSTLTSARMARPLPSPHASYRILSAHRKSTFRATRWQPCGPTRRRPRPSTLFTPFVFVSSPVLASCDPAPCQCDKNGRDCDCVSHMTGSGRRYILFFFFWLAQCKKKTIRKFFSRLRFLPCSFCTLRTRGVEKKRRRSMSVSLGRALGALGVRESPKLCATMRPRRGTATCSALQTTLWSKLPALADSHVGLLALSEALGLDQETKSTLLVRGLASPTDDFDSLTDAPVVSGEVSGEVSALPKDSRANSQQETRAALAETSTIVRPMAPRPKRLKSGVSKKAREGKADGTESTKGPGSAVDRARSRLEGRARKPRSGSGVHRARSRFRGRPSRKCGKSGGRLSDRTRPRKRGCHRALHDQARAASCQHRPNAKAHRSKRVCKTASACRWAFRRQGLSATVRNRAQGHL